MSIQPIVEDFASRNVGLVPDGDRLLVHDPRGSLTDEDRAILRTRKAEILAEIKTLQTAEEQVGLGNFDEYAGHPDNADPVSARDNEFCWGQINRVDFDYLTGPRRYPGPCLGCGGRLAHSRACEAMILATPIPFGKFASKAVGEAPREHLRWLLGRRNLPEEVREAIQLSLRRAGA